MRADWLAACRLLEQGNHAGLTPLHYAVFCDQDEVVAQLVAQDADITAQAEFPDLDWSSVNAGDTAMHVAAHKGSIEVITIMLKAYVSVHARLFRAFRRGSESHRYPVPAPLPCPDRAPPPGPALPCRMKSRVR